MADAKSTPAATSFVRIGDREHACGDNVDQALLINPDADAAVLFAIARARAELLDGLLLVLSTSPCEMAYNPHEIAAMVRPLAEDVRMLLDAAGDRLEAQERARRALEVAAG